MKAKKKQLPSNEKIEENKKNLRELFEKVANGEVEIKNEKETVANKLMLIKNELILLKDKKIPYSILAKMIEENIELKVSEQTLRQFCQEKLGFPKATRKIKDKVELKANKNSEITDSGNEYNATEELYKNQNFE